MSVDNKYLSKLEKYKYKYTYDKILEKINKIYDASSFIRVDNNKKKNGDTEYNLTYGEITNDGIRNIIKFLKEEKLSCCKSTSGRGIFQRLTPPDILNLLQ